MTSPDLDLEPIKNRYILWAATTLTRDAPLDAAVDLALESVRDVPPLMMEVERLREELRLERGHSERLLEELNAGASVE